jgi:hypothetical protein
MSATARRWYALPLGLLGFVLVLGTKFWLQPYVPRLGVPKAWFVSMGVYVLAIGISFRTFVVIIRRHRRRPARFTVANGTFTAPPSPVYAGSQAIVFMCLSAAIVPVRSEIAWSAVLFSVVLFWPIVVALLVIQHPRLELDPGGLTIREMRSRRIAWDQLAPGGPLPPAKRRQGELTLRFTGPSYYGLPPGDRIPISWMDVDPAFLANAIRHYVEHPEHRAAIGTAEELSRLELLAPSTVDRRLRYVPSTSPYDSDQSG